MTERTLELAHELVQADARLHAAPAGPDQRNLRRRLTAQRERIVDRRYLVLRRELAAGRFLERSRPRMAEHTRERNPLT